MKVVHRFLRSQAGSANRMDIFLPKISEDIVVKTLEVRFTVQSDTPNYTLRLLDAASGAVLTIFEKDDSTNIPHDSSLLRFLTGKSFLEALNVGATSSDIIVQIPLAFILDRGTSPFYLETGLNFEKDLVLRIDANAAVSAASVFIHGVFHSKKTITPFISKELISTVGTGGRLKFVFPFNTVHAFTYSTDVNAKNIKIAVYDSGILLTDLENFGQFQYTAWDITDALKNAYIETIDILKPNETYTIVAYGLKSLDVLPNVSRAFKINIEAPDETVML